MSELISLNMGNLTATVDPMGAQLCSLKLNQNEYLWQGNPAFWSRRAPILFPIVGSLRNGRAESAQGPCTMGAMASLETTSIVLRVGTSFQ